MNSSIRTSSFIYAKKALATGTTSCQKADELVKQSDLLLADAKTVVGQLAYLGEAIDAQLDVLKGLKIQTFIEEAAYAKEFDLVLKELDQLDIDLNAALDALKNTKMSPALLEAHKDVSEPRATTLYEFADDQAVEGLKNELREVIDKMHESQERLSALCTRQEDLLLEFQKGAAVLPSTPMFSGRKVADTNQSTQEEILHNMADLLVQLSQHYDNTCTLVKSESIMSNDEFEELQTVVENDARQLDDVLSEMDNHLSSIEDNVASTQSYLDSLIAIQSGTVEFFRRFEEIDLVSLTDSLTLSRKERAESRDQIDVLRTQLVGLTDHYTAFGHSYSSLLQEIDRRSKYEAAVAKYIDQTRRMFAQLATDEAALRDQFIAEHGDTLPGDIWHDVVDRPALHEVIVGSSKALPAISKTDLEEAAAAVRPK